MIAGDAHATDGSSAWLWEMSTWGDLPPTLTGFLTTWYPRDFPILLSFAQAVQTDPSGASGVVHDIAITNLTSSKAVVGQGFTMAINAAVANHGDFNETFNVTAYANSTPVASQRVTLSRGDSTNVTFTWNTTGSVYGNYTLSAYAPPVPGETNTADNNRTGGVATVSIPGDIDGDFKVGLADLVLLANAYGSKPGDMIYNPNADGAAPWEVIGLSDLVVLAVDYGQHYP
jgi:hypothetical protein